MPFTIPPILVYIASWFGMIGGVWALFDRAEKVVDPIVKEKISKWMSTTQVPVDERWPATFESLSDRVFGRRLLSARSVIVSCLFSTVSVAALFAIFYFLHPEIIFVAVDEFGLLFYFFMLLLLPGIANFLQDYLSVIQTRLLLRRIAQSSTLITQMLFLFIDFLLTSFLVWISYFFLMKLVAGEYSAARTGEMLIGGLRFKIPVAALIYSTFLTSIWIWLYVLSGALVRLASKFSWSLEIMRKFLNLKERPLQSIGFVSMLFVTLVYLIIPFVVNS